jgi:hypothetical protein
VLEGLSAGAPAPTQTDLYAEDRQIIGGVLRRLDRYREASRPKFRAMIRNHRLYTADPRINDPRDPVKEKWRSWVTSTKVHSNVNTESAIVTDVITSSDPLIKASRVHDAQQSEATYGENVLDYIAEGNQLRSRLLPELARNLSIQGTVVVKCDFVDFSREGELYTTQEDMEAWWSKVLEIAGILGVQPPDMQTDPKGFEVWKQQAEMAGNPIPDFPKSGRQMIRGYKGPWYSIPKIWDIFMDPFQPDMQRQECIIEVVIQPRSLLDGRLAAQRAAGGGTIDEQAVTYARKHGLATSSEKFNEYVRSYYEYLDLSPQNYLVTEKEDPWDVFYEVYMPNGAEHKYLSILNECAIINTKRDVSPFPFGDAPYFSVKRIPMTGSAYGLSPIQAVERLIYEISATRSKRMDLTNLAGNPAFEVVAAAYNDLPKTGRSMIAGGFYKVPTKGSISQIQVAVPDALFRENAETERETDETWGIGGNLRGQQATVGRVPATETQARQTQATLPLIAVARQIEDGLASTFPWCFLMLREYCSDEELVGMGGSGGGELLRIDKAKLALNMAQKFRFQGATSTRNRDQQSTMIANGVRTFANAIQPHELRKLAVHYFRLQGLPGVDELMDPQVTEAMEQSAMMMLNGGMGQPGAPGAVPGQPPQPGQGPPGQDGGVGGESPEGPPPQ